MRPLREYVGDMTRMLPSVVDSFESIFGTLSRVGGPTRIYNISGTEQQGAIYTVGHNGSAIGFGWGRDNLVTSVYWWDRFDFGSPDYSLELSAGVDIGNYIEAAKTAITTKTIGEIAL